MNGLLVIDKPGGMTSRDAVNRVQRWLPRKTKIGHTGTLDPLATGVLVVCVGAATRLADTVQAMGKSYTSRFRLGARSTSDDADGAVTETPGVVPPTREQVEAALAGFVGVIEQVPPAVSALKVGGRRAHALARKGEVVELAARPVRVDAIRVTGYEWPFLAVEVDCGKGTYIRSIARDLGARLGCGGLVQTLRRTRVGPFTAEQGVGVDEPPADLGAALRPMVEAVAGMPVVTLGDEVVRRFRQGQVVPASGGRQPPEGCPIAVFDTAGKLTGIGSPVGSSVRPEIVFNT
ncbi:MAG: tRNA pseudouridine(55) synthase TruB [Gemmataceae bacterium]|nr:tRNA pseudouridine(55) synthase TruB [Gemmataceae bacterium]